MKKIEFRLRGGTLFWNNLSSWKVGTWRSRSVELSWFDSISQYHWPPLRMWWKKLDSRASVSRLFAESIFLASFSTVCGSCSIWLTIVILKHKCRMKYTCRQRSRHNSIFIQLIWGEEKFEWKRETLSEAQYKACRQAWQFSFGRSLDIRSQRFV